MSQDLIEGLQSPSCFDHPVEHLQVLETHISWVILTGPFAYKIKKPVDLGFLDFSTLDQRHHFCKEELRLNSRFSKDLYLAVLPIHRDGEGYRMGGAGEAVEYAVQMRQFEQDERLDKWVSRQALSPADLKALGRRLAHFHTRQAALPGPREADFGTPDAIARACLDNFRQIQPLLLEEGDARDSLEDLQHWTRTQLSLFNHTFKKRRENGFVRECHGDLHLANIAFIEGEITFFDCIEFNPALRWIDTLSELAFLLMDLEEKQLQAEANRLLNSYLEFSGDYAGLELLQFYKVYRAMVRAKVEVLRLQAGEMSSEQIQQCREEYGKYFDLAQSYRQQGPCFLALMHGVSGTGKSTMAARLAADIGGIRLRSDVERKRLFGLTPDARSNSEQHPEMYEEDTSDRTFAVLLELARTVLNSGYPVFVDATFINAQRRRPFLALARELDLPLLILDCQASEETLLQRLTQRQQQGGSTSEAGIEVMRQQLARVQPFSEDEQPYVVPVDTEQVDNPVEIQQWLDRRLADE